MDGLKINLTKRELELKETVDGLNNRLKQLNEENDRIKKELHDMFTQVKDHESDILKTTQEHSELKSELEKSKKENERLDRENETMIKSIQISTNKINTLTLEHLKEKEQISLVFINYINESNH